VTSTTARHRVVIVGGGFGGLYAARALKGASVDVTLIDRRNFHLFTPLLYQVATGALAPSEIAQPLRALLRGGRVRVLLGEATDVEPGVRTVVLSDGATVPYDTLVVATGTSHAYFGHPEWESRAPGLKSIEDALEIRRRILIAFEAAERETDPDRRRALMTFVIVGGGPTGVELAGAIGEIAHDALRADFREINPPDARIVLVEALDRILPTYPASLSRAAARALAELGVTVRTGTRVTTIDDEGVALVAAAAPAEGPQATAASRAAGGEAAPAEETQRIPGTTVLWAAGVRVPDFGQAVVKAFGAPTDRAGRIHVGPDLTLPGHPEAFVIGDLALVAQPGDRIVPGVAQGAIQGGRYVARVVRARIAGDPAPDPFRYKDRGELATVGRLRAVADFRRFRFSGRVAWLLWLAIHLFWLIGLQNRILVFIRWAWSFLTKGRGNRLITGAHLLPEVAVDQGSTGTTR
jgi:NADH dehydrogenase